MAEFKLVIGDPKTGKSHQVVVADDNASSLIGKKIGDKIKGESFDMPGYEFEITGGADYCGFPMRRDVEGPVRKKIMITEGVGIRNKNRGIRKRKTVCGNTVHDKITQVSMKILKHGKKPLGEPEEKAEEPAEEPKQEKKAEEKKEEKKPEEKPSEEKPKQEPEKKQEKPKQKEEKPKTDETPLKEVKGVGPKTAEELKDAGIETAEELADKDPEKLAKETDLSEKQAEKIVEEADKV